MVFDWTGAQRSVADSLFRAVGLIATAGTLPLAEEQRAGLKVFVAVLRIIGAALTAAMERLHRAGETVWAWSQVLQVTEVADVALRCHGDQELGRLVGGGVAESVRHAYGSGEQPTGGQHVPGGAGGEAHRPAQDVEGLLVLAVHVRRRPGPPGRIVPFEQAKPPAGGAAVLQDAMHDRTRGQAFAAVRRDHVNG